MKKIVLLLTLLCSFSIVSTASADVLPEFNDDDPAVTIRQGDQATYYEYRVNGQLIEIKVKPTIGKTYYLIPTDDGEFYRSEDSNLMLPKWILFSW
ncbi:DUF2782 domain-containing protein [Amphritea sp. 1_MG-2023]|uniref:DUF2782 domain-containing protein n=1 Tax=Amphritea sp. 1_MG-2023 TaxID=3062670 RepID=UPI0026E47769|nr:DUF2782 domain-containing protein [Amphritea sp. 1_MG-2023]MDO6562442.1 DUF2782 domain-containing protein [Amphritea sp. 1_MG-2023]